MLPLASHYLMSHHYHLSLSDVTRLSLLQQWAEAQGLELAAECHLVRLSQAAQLILADKSTPDQVSEESNVIM